MNMKNLLWYPSIVLLLLFTGILTYSQGTLIPIDGQDTYILKNGIGVSMAPLKSDVLVGKTTLSVDKKKLHRVLIDNKNKKYFGYDLSIEPDETRETYLISITKLTIAAVQNDGSLSGLSFVELIKKDTSLKLNKTDIFVLPFLVNPITKEKISDVIDFRFHFADSNIPRERLLLAIPGKPTFPLKTLKGNFIVPEIKDFTLQDVSVGLNKPILRVNGKTIDDSNVSIWGENVYIYIPNKGRFIISAFPRKGYDFKQIGTAAYETIVIEHDGDVYNIRTKSPILGAAGVWKLWVLVDKDFKPNPKYGDVDGVTFGAATRVDTFFDKAWNQKK